jgi:integrase
MNKGRPRKISPYLNGKTYCARFRNYESKLINRSLKTKDYTTSLLLCKELEILCLNPEAETSVCAQSIYFGKEKEYKALKPSGDIFQDLAKAQQEIEQLNKLVEYLRPYKEKYEALTQEKEYRLLEAFRDLPKFIEVFEVYKSNVSHLDGNGSDHISLLEKLAESQNLWPLLITEVENINIQKFLSQYSETGKDPSERWNRARRKLHRFWKWLSVTYNVDNLITRIETKKEQVKASIQWHTLEEVQKEIKSQNDYWAAIIGIMLFAGLSAHEVRGLKKSDLIGYYISINPSEERRTKSINRIRQVKIHQEYLAPLINKYLLKENKSLYLFPPYISGSKIWLKDSFSKHFRKIIINKDINALSLRRTFGSLLLRSGKNSAEVAAAMGNTEEMVRKHYARLLGCEIDINF